MSTDPAFPLFCHENPASRTSFTAIPNSSSSGSSSGSKNVCMVYLVIKRGAWATLFCARAVRPARTWATLLTALLHSLHVTSPTKSLCVFCRACKHSRHCMYVLSHCFFAEISFYRDMPVLVLQLLRWLLLQALPQMRLQLLCWYPPRPLLCCTQFRFGFSSWSRRPISSTYLAASLTN